VTSETPLAYETRQELPPLTKTITQDKINRYADASGDHNPLHLDPEFASTTQFGGTIAHGMLVLAYLSEALAAWFGDRWAGSGRLKARFRAPARPGDSVTINGRVTSVADGSVVCAVEAVNQKGELLVSADAEVSG
jgi:3-hydroxybutyryl-CoA dehydratase